MNARASRHGMPPRTRGGWRRAIVSLGLVAACGAAMVVPSAEMTEAAWADQEVATGSFTAISVPAPGSGGACVIAGSLLNLLGTSLSIKWTMPAGYTTSNIGISYTGSGGLVPVVDTLLGTNLKTTVNAGVYTTTLTGTLLNATLGAERVLQVQTVHPSGWVSDLRAVTGNWPFLGLGSLSCVDSLTPKSN